MWTWSLKTGLAFPLNYHFVFVSLALMQLGAAVFGYFCVSKEVENKPDDQITIESVSGDV